jgi:hypothetical protein
MRTTKEIRSMKAKHKGWKLDAMIAKAQRPS